MLAREKEREREKKLHIFCQLNYDLLNPNDPEWKCDTLHNVICFCMERKISNPSASVLSIIFSPSCWAYGTLFSRNSSKFMQDFHSLMEREGEREWE